jgi:hypothetical protein
MIERQHCSSTTGDVSGEIIALVGNDANFEIAPTWKDLQTCCDGLPDELILSIFQPLPRGSLAKLCEVNKRC